MNTTRPKAILISGASFAGLSSAWWMSELGHDVTVVESAPAIRTGGTPVNIRNNTIEIVRRMGLFDEIAARRLTLRQIEFRNPDDTIARTMVVREEGQPQPDDDYEIERDVLITLLHDAVKHRCRIVFDDSITGLSQTDRVAATFARHPPATFDLVLGCDGAHSRVRELCFGHESLFVHDLRQHFAITIVDGSLVERDTLQLFNVPGKAVMLNAYKDRTDIVFAFASDEPAAVDRRDQARQRALIEEQFATAGWRCPELLAALARSDNFYFDRLCQIRMPAWSTGRVALVGDAAYCASPAAGMGGSLAIDGAAALGQAMRSAGDDHALALRRYDESLRPFVEQVQADAVRNGLESLVPRTWEAIHARNARTGGDF